MQKKSAYDPVTDDEELYRRINLKVGVANKDGKYQLSASSFNDSYFQPSVDRAYFKDHKPENSKVKSTDGIAKLITGNVRAYPVVVENTNFDLDVKPAPSKTNDSHALIIYSPEYKHQTYFRKIQERLARLASVVIEPS